MRITNQSLYIPFETNLEGIQDRRFKEDLRISSGKQIVALADNPQNLSIIKMLTSQIDQTTQFKSNVEDSLGELYVASEQLGVLGDKIQNIREVNIDALNISNHSALSSIAQHVKGLIDDLIKAANLDFNGHFLFSGTKSTPNTLDKNGVFQNDMPFEIFQGTATATNPSGLQVTFKGNFKDREIQKDKQTTEVINVKADQIFGKDGKEALETLVELYNILEFNPKGEVRITTSPLSKEEFGKINTLQKRLGEFYDNITSVSAQFGSKINRFESIRDQMQNELTNLEAMRSTKNDTDVAKATINLRKEELALQYSLQVGARLLQNSLFDFLK
ncbi:MAG: flgL [Ignavibacteria bacterium]|nr:flgL [Ignavibacteria bacterium]